ncbi:MULTISPECIES: ABC transporter ATP-binding protein [Streptomyces]|uniref:ABC transporter ATP-binding protein n=1 Tax=Streptomyces lonegramiae TaxID=3075524 RepID=A0ABU2XWJ6_9ACTN|nr:ABC transporter ATP-binding protein [Streptomyces sp. DSM 41529]MDT0549872.1 ABC transporter ATP-binding protein [Streptomyces sp. DSM 41529]
MTAADTPVVEFAGVAKHYGAVRAVKGIDLTIRRGESIALLGRNGAGKSTSIGILLGLLPPSEGRVRLFGGAPEAAVRSGRIGAMLQEGALITRVTVRELVAFVAGTYPRPLPVAETLELAGLTHLAERRADRLSGGQAQRLRFALAMAGGPELVVLDEPTAALDVSARREFWAAMRGYAARGNTVLFSTHYLEEADENADRIVVIDKGRKVADGTGEEIKRTVGGNVVAFDLGDRSSEGLEQLPGVTSVEIRRSRAYLRSADSDATVLALAERGDVRNLEVRVSRLEDAFVALTTGADDTDGADGAVSADDMDGRDGHEDREEAMV